MFQIFHLFFYQPLLNLLVFVYNLIPYHDIGIAIIVLTVIIKVILYPFSVSAIRTQKKMQEIQPKIDELKIKYKDNQEQQAKEMMNLYKQSKVNPFSSCLQVIIQLPFLIAVYQVFTLGLTNGNVKGLLYSFISDPGKINTIAFGFLDLSKPQVFLAVLAGLAQYWQAKMLLAKKPAVNVKESQDESMTAIMNKQMMYVMPIMTVFIGFTLPGGLSLYWLVLTLLTVLQQKIVFKKIHQEN